MALRLSNLLGYQGVYQKWYKVLISKGIKKSGNGNPANNLSKRPVSPDDLCRINVSIAQTLRHCLICYLSRMNI